MTNKIEFDINKSTDERFNLKKLKEIYKCVIEVMSPDEFLFYCQYKKYKFDQIQEIADEEKKHVGEFQKLIAMLDKNEIVNYKKGAEEV